MVMANKLKIWLRLGRDYIKVGELLHESSRKNHPPPDLHILTFHCPLPLDVNRKVHNCLYEHNS